MQIFRFQYAIYLISSIGGDRVNHQNAETWMLTQRIGVFEYQKYLAKDGQARVFLPSFYPFEDGRLYKGQW